MVYSPAFDALPAALRERIWKRAFALMRDDDRAAVAEILRDTKPGLALPPASAR